MSIIGLSEKLRLPRRGKIRLGEKKVSAKGKEYPSALDYFARGERNSTSFSCVVRNRLDCLLYTSPSPRD